jgi:putative MATE family efflux protein
MNNEVLQQDLRLEISTKHILALALPISASILVPQINYFTNNIFLGKLGEAELGAAGITGVYYLIFGAIGYALNNGLQSLIAHRAGENRPEEIGKIFAQGLRIALLISLFGIIVTYIAAPYAIHHLLKNEATAKRVIDFLLIRIWGLPFLYLYQMRNALLVGTNQSKFLVIGTLAETLTNIVLDYGLIFGFLGLPKLGFNGAAYASIIAECIGMLVVFAIIRSNSLTQSFKIFQHLKFHKENTWLVVKRSSPLIFQYAMSIISWEIFFILVERNGKGIIDLAISNSMRNIFGLFGVFTWAFAATSSTMVSNIIGQKRDNEVEKLIGNIVKISTGVSLVVFLLLNIFPYSFLRIFSMNELFITEAIPVLRVVSLALVLMSFSTIWLNAVVGTGKTKINLLIECFTVALYLVYIYVVMEVKHLSIAWGWGSEWLYWTSTFLLSYWFIKKGKWKRAV